MPRGRLILPNFNALATNVGVYSPLQLGFITTIVANVMRTMTAFESEDEENVGAVYMSKYLTMYVHIPLVPCNTYNNQ